ncbi:MAG: MFS transporter [Fervidobacterium sp.]
MLDNQRKLSNTFHLYHFISFLISIQAYLFSTFINSTATKWGFSFVEIGILNFISSIAYAIASITIGHLGDKFGYKKMLFILFFYLNSVSIFGLFSKNTLTLYMFALTQGVFFGSFFPQVEGLIAKSETLIDIDPPSITGRFTLSWSTGNIIGVAFGPYLTVHARYFIFILGLFISLLFVFIIHRDLQKNGEFIKFSPNNKLIKHQSNSLHKQFVGKVVQDKFLMKRFRLEYRIILFLGGLIYTSVLASFPKLITLAGIELSKAGFLTVGANIGVLLTFITLQYWKKWVGNEKVSAVLLTVIPLTGLFSIFAKSSLVFFLTAFFAGCSYAIPYTFAIFYGLLSTNDEHGKQGALHEMTIGLLFGFGPLVGGFFLDNFKNGLGLALLSLIVIIIVYFVQVYSSIHTKKLKVFKS